MAFDRDPLKLILTRDEMNLGSTVLDDLAVRYVALATTDQPFGRVVDADAGWDTMRPAGDAAIEGTAPGPVGGVALPLRVSGACDGAAVQVSLDSGGTVLGRSARPAFDVDGWTSFALTGQALNAGDSYRLVVSSTDPACRVDVGMAGDRVARQVIVLDRDEPVRLVSTEGAWIYERPTAWELVSAHTRWRAFADQAELLAWVTTRSPAEADVAAFVGTGPSPSPSPGTSHGRRLPRSTAAGCGPRRAADATSLLVVSMNRSAGWTATVDGRPTPLVSVDGALMGVFVPAGDHVVRLRYLPKSFVVGAAVTGIALAAAVGRPRRARLAQPEEVRRSQRHRDLPSLGRDRGDGHVDRLQRAVATAIRGRDHLLAPTRAPRPPVLDPEVGRPGEHQHDDQHRLEGPLRNPGHRLAEDRPPRTQPSRRGAGRAAACSAAGVLPVSRSGMT